MPVSRKNDIIYEYQFGYRKNLAARAKMSLSRAQNIFTPANINSIVILADDTNNFFTRINAKEVECTMNEALTLVLKYCAINNLKSYSADDTQFFY